MLKHLTAVLITYFVMFVGPNGNWFLAKEEHAGSFKNAKQVSKDVELGYISIPGVPYKIPAFRVKNQELIPEVPPEKGNKQSKELKSPKSF